MGISANLGWVRRGFRWLLATAAALITTAILMALHMDASAAGIAYLVLVVWFATIVGPGPSIYLAVVCAIAFDYFFLAPIFSFAITGRDILAMAAYLLACVVVNRVAERARRQTRQAEQRREDVERLYALSQEMMLHDDAAGLVREIPRLVERNFALDAVVLHVRDEGQIYSSVPGATTEELRGILASAAAAIGTAGAAGSELAEGYFAINLVFGMNSAGTLAWKPAKLSREVATSVAAQVAIAITRANAIEAFARVEAARSADRLRTALIDSLTHELRTPLTAIRAAATTLVDGRGLDAESRDELAAIVDEESLRLDSLIGEAMEIAEIESDGIRVRLEPVQMGTFLEQAVEESRALLASHRLTIIVKPPDTPVWLDPLLMGRVLRHLLENAARYTPPNSQIAIRVSRTMERLEMTVEDDGPGIDPYDLPLIFEKFYRGRKRTSRAKGSGMGLAITRAILTAHGGAIEVESSAGKGTVFRFWIPLVERAGTVDSQRE
jgi:two-component system, OmpR family, sensor histidine kinase KdpD